MTAVIRAGRVGDYSVVLDRLLAAFADAAPAHPPFDALYPDCIRPDDACMRDWLLADVDGQIAAGMQVVPRPMILAGGLDVKAAGLGQVFCLPAFRKHGLMSDLLRTVIAKMEREEYLFCVLSGDRQRYRRFGWELAGSVRQLRLHARRIAPSAGNDLETAGGPAWPAPRRGPAGPEDLARMFAAYGRLPYRGVRTAAEFAAVLRRHNTCTWIQEGEGGFAYVCLQGDRIAEYAGDAAALTALVAHLVARCGLQVSLPPAGECGAAEAVFNAFAGWFGVQPAGMIRIFSLERLLQAYQPLLQRRLAGWRGRLELAVAGAPADGAVIAGDGSSVTVGAGVPAAGAPRLELERPDWAPVLFGPFLPDELALEWRDHEVIRRLFPLPVFWSALNTI